MRERWLLIASVALLVAGVVGALVHRDAHVAPAACARRVARALDYEVLTEPAVRVAGSSWVATVPAARVVVRVEGEGHRVTDVQALAGPGADLLERPERLVGLNVRC